MTQQRRDNKLAFITRLCFTPLIFVTAIFGPALMLFPGSTEDYWAWPIQPKMSAFWVGASYTFGAIAITTMLLVGRWTSALVPVVATWPFSVVMLVATLIHNDRFFTDSVGYYIWLAIYLILPFALPAMFWLNRKRAAPRRDSELLLPAWLRYSLAAAGVGVGLLGLVLVLAPSALDQSWPWLLTPLMSRIIGGWLLFLATGGLASLLEPRYEAYRYYLLTTAIWFSLLLLGSLVLIDDFDFDRPATFLYFVAVVVTILGATAMFGVFERRSRTVRDPATAGAIRSA